MLELHYVKLTNIGDLTKPKQIFWGFLHAKNQNSLASNYPYICQFNIMELQHFLSLISEDIPNLT